MVFALSSDLLHGSASRNACRLQSKWLKLYLGKQKTGAAAVPSFVWANSTVSFGWPQVKMVFLPRSFLVIWQHFCSLGCTTETSIPVRWPSKQRARQECASHVHGDEIHFITYVLFFLWLNVRRCWYFRRKYRWLVEMNWKIFKNDERYPLDATIYYYK